MADGAMAEYRFEDPCLSRTYDDESEDKNLLIEFESDT
jgi:hypothetical protein